MVPERGFFAFAGRRSAHSGAKRRAIGRICRRPIRPSARSIGRAASSGAQSTRVANGENAESRRWSLLFAMRRAVRHRWNAILRRMRFRRGRARGDL